MNIGGNFRLHVWEEKIKRNMTYIDPPRMRFENDLTGKKNAFFDMKPLSEACIEARVKRQALLHPLDWQTFEANALKNGHYKAPAKDTSAHIRAEYKKGRITEPSLNGYLALCKRYKGVYPYGAYSKFKAGEIAQTDFL